MSRPMNTMGTQGQGWESVRWATEWPVKYRRFAGFRRLVAGLRQWLWERYAVFLGGPCGLFPHGRPGGRPGAAPHRDW